MLYIFFFFFYEVDMDTAPFKISTLFSRIKFEDFINYTIHSFRASQIIPDMIIKIGRAEEEIQPSG